MGQWLDRLLPPPQHKNKSGLPSLRQRLPALVESLASSGKEDKIPNASLIYGVAAAVLLGIALYFTFGGRWFTALLLLFPAGCFVGFSLFFLRHADE